MSVNTSTAVRSASCIYLAGITLEPAPCGPPLGILIKRSAAVPKGPVSCTSSLSTRFGSFYAPLRTPEPRPRVLVGVHQCSQLVSTSWPLAFRSLFFLPPFFLRSVALALSVARRHLQWAAAPSQPEGKHGKHFPASLFSRKVRTVIGLLVIINVKVCAALCVYLPFFKQVSKVRFSRLALKILY